MRAAEVRKEREQGNVFNYWITAERFVWMYNEPAVQVSIYSSLAAGES